MTASYRSPVQHFYYRRILTEQATGAQTFTKGDAMGIQGTLLQCTGSITYAAKTTLLKYNLTEWLPQSQGLLNW